MAPLSSYSWIRGSLAKTKSEVNIMKLQNELMLIAFVLSVASLVYARYVTSKAKITEQNDLSIWDHLQIGAPKLEGACLCGKDCPHFPNAGKGLYLTREEFTRRLLRATFKKTRSSRAIGHLWTVYARLKRKTLALKAAGTLVPARLTSKLDFLEAKIAARIDKVAWKRSVTWSFCMHCGSVVRKSKLSLFQRRFTSVNDTDVAEWVKSTIQSKLAQWYQLEVAGHTHPLTQVDTAVPLLQEEE